MSRKKIEILLDQAEKSHEEMLRNISNEINKYMDKIKEIEARMKEYKAKNRKVFKE